MVDAITMIVLGLSLFTVGHLIFVEYEDDDDDDVVVVSRNHPFFPRLAAG